MSNELDISPLCSGIEHWRNVDIYGVNWEDEIIYFKFSSENDFFKFSMNDFDIDSVSDWQHIKLAMDVAMTLIFCNERFPSYLLCFVKNYIKEMLIKPYAYCTYTEVKDFKFEYVTTEEEEFLKKLYDKNGEQTEFAKGLKRYYNE